MPPGHGQCAQRDRKIENGEGTLGKLVSDEALYRDTSEAARRISSITRKLDEGRGPSAG